MGPARIAVLVSVSRSAPIGPRIVTVTNRDGGRGSRAGALRIT